MAHDQSSDDGDAERTPELRARAGSERQGQRAQERGHGRHCNRAKTQKTGFIDRVFRALAFLAFSFQREIDHENGVFLNDADQENNTDESNHALVIAEKQKRQKRSHSGGWQR